MDRKQKRQWRPGESGARNLEAESILSEAEGKVWKGVYIVVLLVLVKALFVVIFHKHMCFVLRFYISPCPLYQTNRQYYQNMK